MKRSKVKIRVEVVDEYFLENVPSMDIAEIADHMNALTTRFSVLGHSKPMTRFDLGESAQR